MCPLSLRLTFRIQRSGVSSHADALRMEYNICVQACKYRNANFLIGIKARLIDKSKDKPQWTPATIEEISEFDLVPYLNNVEGPRLAFPYINDVSAT